jgi:hypothetical protein
MLVLSEKIRAAAACTITPTRNTANPTVVAVLALERNRDKKMDTATMASPNKKNRKKYVGKSLSRKNLNWNI